MKEEEFIKKILEGLDETIDWSKWAAFTVDEEGLEYKGVFKKEKGSN